MKDSYEFKEFVDYNTQQERKYSFSTPDCSVAGHKFLRDEREYWGIVHQKISMCLPNRLREALYSSTRRVHSGICVRPAS